MGAAVMKGRKGAAFGTSVVAPPVQGRLRVGVRIGGGLPRGAGQGVSPLVPNHPPAHGQGA
jgi:hypothetical protein